MTELEIKDTCPNLDESYYESLSEHQEIDVENGPETEIEDDLSFMEADIDAPKEEKHQPKQIDMSWLMDIIKNDEQNKEKELKTRYTFDDMLAELLTIKIKELGNKFIGWNKFDISCDMVKKFIKPLTREEENKFIRRMDELPANKTLYSFSLCRFGVIPDFARRDFIDLFLEYKNTIKQSAPTPESLKYAKELLGLQYHKLTDLDKRVLKIKNNGTYQTDDIYYCHSGDYDLDMLCGAAMSEYFDHKTVEIGKYDVDDPLDRAVILVDYLCRHDEIVAILEKLKALRETIRYKMRLPENEYVGF